MRPDSLIGGGAHKNTGTQMTQYLKRSMMHSLRDSFEIGRLEIRSSELVNELRTVVNDEGSIEAAGRGKENVAVRSAENERKIPAPGVGA